MSAVLYSSGLPTDLDPANWRGPSKIGWISCPNTFHWIISAILLNISSNCSWNHNILVWILNVSWIQSTDFTDVKDWTSAPTSGLYEWVFVHRFLFARYSILTVLFIAWACVCLMLSMLAASRCRCCYSMCVSRSRSMCVQESLRVCVLVLTCVCEANQTNQTNDRIVCRFSLLEQFSNGYEKAVEGIYTQQHQKQQQYTISLLYAYRCLLNPHTHTHIQFICHLNFKRYNSSIISYDSLYC